MFEELPVGTQLILVCLGLAVLFFLVRLNNKNNRKKRLGNRKFGERIKKSSQEKEKDFNQSSN